VAPANRTATLEVTSSQAERVLVAGRLGKLSLSVLAADRRADNAAPAGQAETMPLSMTRVAPAANPSQTGVTWAADVSPALGSGDTHKAPAKMLLFQGSSESKEFHF
jgi:Flp pilus assembly protein CpaB